MMLSSKFSFKIATVTEFSNDVAVPVGSENFMALKNVWVVEFFENIDLGEQ